MRNAFFAAILLLGPVVIGGVARLAWAYIPPAEYILQTLAKKHKGYRQITMRTLVTALDGSGQPTATRFKEVTVFYPASGLLKSWASDEKGATLYEMTAQGKSLSPSAALLLESSPGTTTQALKARGIPVMTWTELGAARADAKSRQEEQEPPATTWKSREKERLSSKASKSEDGKKEKNELPPPPAAPPTGVEKNLLTRWNKTMVWILGIDNVKNKGTSPQVWIEKDTFLPLRLFAALEPEHSNDLIDLTYENFRYNKEFPYPRTILFNRVASKQPVLRADLTDIQVDTGPDLSRNRITPGFTGEGNSAPSALKELVQSYYTVVR